MACGSGVRLQLAITAVRARERSANEIKRLREQGCDSTTCQRGAKPWEPLTKEAPDQTEGPRFDDEDAKLQHCAEPHADQKPKHQAPRRRAAAVNGARNQGIVNQESCEESERETRDLVNALPEETQPQTEKSTGEKRGSSVPQTRRCTLFGRASNRECM